MQGRVVGVARSPDHGFSKERMKQLTGLRNPCAQIEAFRPGLLREMVTRDVAGQIVRRAGVMAVVEQGGVIAVDAGITVALPDRPHHPLERV